MQPHHGQPYEGWRSSVRSTTASLPFLVQLRLFGNPIGDAGVAELAKALAVNSTLKVVCSLRDRAIRSHALLRMLSALGLRGTLPRGHRLHPPCLRWRIVASFGATCAHDLPLSARFCTAVLMEAPRECCGEGQARPRAPGFHCQLVASCPLKQVQHRPRRLRKRPDGPALRANTFPGWSSKGS